MKKALPLFGFLSIAIGLLCLISLIVVVISMGWESLDIHFLTSFPSRFPDKAGILSAILGSLWVLSLTAVLAIPLGILTAIYLVEYAEDSIWKRIIEVNISNLSAIPSVVYGILGLAVFVRFFGFDRSILSGALTMSLLILPTIVISSMEALKAVPPSLRMAAYGVGATPRQVIWFHVLPYAFPSIVTGILLGLSRAIGESAPLIMIGALSFVAFLPETPFDSFTVLAIQIFNWAGRPQEAFQHIAAAGIIVLLFFTLGMNGLAVWLRSRFSRGQ